jgi:hypothetical protein
VEQSESQPGFFIHLSKYAPTRVATPLENFVAKAFAYLLKCCPQARRALSTDFTDSHRQQNTTDWV